MWQVRTARRSEGTAGKEARPPCGHTMTATNPTPDGGKTLADSIETKADGREPTQYRKIVRTRPLGAVVCSRCGENKNNGEGVTIGTYRSYGHPFDTDKRVLCDSCLRSLREWYRERENEQGFVPTKWAGDSR